MEEKFIVSAWYNMVRISQTFYQKNFFCLKSIFQHTHTHRKKCFLIILSYHYIRVCSCDNLELNEKECVHYFQVLKPEMGRIPQITIL